MNARFALALALIALSSRPAGAAAKVAALSAQFDGTAAANLPQDIFDEAILSALQKIPGLEVIGQDDIATLVGFEKQKDLLGCDDATCFADLGGALGVDRIVAVKVALIAGEWTVAAKLVNIRSAKVEARLTEFVSGTGSTLLKAIPGIIGQLFRVSAPTSVPALTSPNVPGQVSASGGRALGMVLSIAGLGAGAAALFAFEFGNTTGYVDYITFDQGAAFLTAGGVALSMAVVGWGSAFGVDASAQALSNDRAASGEVGYRKIAWGVGAATALVPTLVLAMGGGRASKPVADFHLYGTLAGMAVTSGMFVASMFSRPSIGPRSNEAVQLTPVVMTAGSSVSYGFAVIASF